MDLGLQGKVALVTGASRGIGRAIAESLAAEGVRLALAARDQAALEDVAAAVEAAGSEAFLHAADLRAPDAPQAFRDAAIAHYGRIDLVVGNAGATKRGDFLELGEADWADGFALKFHGHVRLTRAAWPDLVASKGTLLFVIGVGGRTPGAEFTIGGSVNAALMNFTKSMADRGVADGVRVCAVNPGSIATARLQTRIRSYAAEHKLDDAAAADGLARAMGIARFGTPAEIADVITFLASSKAGYAQGALIDIDGGVTRTL
jgi:3-oxoacyl-[acyl-carrier protein] reductase